MHLGGGGGFFLVWGLDDGTQIAQTTQTLVYGEGLVGGDRGEEAWDGSQSMQCLDG
jgi:hypothetical protein